MTLPLKISCPTLFLCLLLVGTACNKVKDYERATWEDRPKGKKCDTRHNSSPDFNDPTQLFNKDHLYCIAIEMDKNNFEVMRYESRFGPSVLDQGGVSARKAGFEYFYQCDVAFPSYYKWYKANVEIDGEVVEDIGIRKKGFLGSIFSIAPSIKLDINRYSSGREKLGALKKMTLNNNSEDPSRLMQVLFYRFYDWADYPSPQCNLANVTINGESLGVYSNVEHINEDFLLRAFGNNTGSLYECQLTDFRMNWVNRWESKTAATDRGKKQLTNIAYVLENTKKEDMLAKLDLYINIDNFIRFWALEIITNHIDGYCRNSNNVYLYFDPNDNDRGTFIPTGVNYFQSAKYQGTPIKEFMTAELPRRLSFCPGVPELLEIEIIRLLEEKWDVQQLRQLINHFKVQVLNSQMDLNDGKGLIQHYFPTLKKWVANREATLKSALATEGIPIGNPKPSNTCHFEE